ncbi:MAG TPA: hypothetical protein VJP02_11350 [Candidatus Sulfotelmatobacter sp.]|nr:hypothetical protein [Candidatus Sulfotelmatobacter sp.]
MKETTATLNSAEVLRHEVPNAGAGESQAVPAPAIVATTEDIRAGIVLIKSDAVLPNSVRFESKHYGRWKLLTGADGFQVERRLSEAGWHFFLMVPEVRIRALSSNRKRGLRKVLRKVLSATEAQGFNAVEVVDIKTRHFVGFHSVEVVAYARQVKNSPFLRDLDPNHVSRNTWNFKQILRSQARIGPTRKGI